MAEEFTQKIEVCVTINRAYIVIATKINYFVSQIFPLRMWSS